MSRLTLRIAYAAIILMAPIELASAGEGEHVLSIRPEYVNFGSHGGGLSLGYQWGFDDFVNLWVDAGWSYAPEVETDGQLVSAQRVFSTLGIVYHLDSFQWVPYLSTSLGVYGQLPDLGQATAAFGFELGGGVDYRPTRIWSIGVFGMFHAIAAGDLPHHGSAGLRLNIYFR